MVRRSTRKVVEQNANNGVRRVMAPFATGLNGTVYDYSNVASLNQVSTGTTAGIIATNPAGFTADARFGMALGPELVDTLNTVAASPEWTQGGNNLIELDVDAIKITYVDTLTGANGFFSSVRGLNSDLVPGKTYKVTYKAKTNAGNTVVTINNPSQILNLPLTTEYTEQQFIFRAFSPVSDCISFAAMSAGEIVWIKNISVRLFEGNHAVQATAGARTTWTNKTNLLKHIDTISSTYWNMFRCTSVPNNAIAPDGTLTATTVTITQQYGGPMQVNIPCAASTTYTYTVWARSVSGNTVLSMTYLTLPNAATYGNAINITSTWTKFTYTFTTVANQTSFGQVLPIQDRNASGHPTIFEIWQPSIETEHGAEGFPYYLKFDGIDDYLSSTTGGGGINGFFWCGVVQPTAANIGKVLWTDLVNLNGYRLTITAGNVLSLFAGDGTALTSISSITTLASGTQYLLSAWDDGINLNVQIDAGEVRTIARPIVAAGGPGYSIGVIHGGSSNYLNGNLYPNIYWRDTAGTAAQRAHAQAWCRIKAGL